MKPCEQLSAGLQDVGEVFFTNREGEEAYRGQHPLSLARFLTKGS